MAKKRREYKPYALMMALLYGSFSWIERHEGGELTLPVRQTCEHFRYEAKELRAALEMLYTIGVVEKPVWRSTWAIIRPVVPKGMRRKEIHVQELTIDIKEDCGAF
jgi:hypothetical protein